MHRSPKHSKPEVDIKHCGQTGYWVVTITCKDRNKLLFDTVRHPLYVDIVLTHGLRYRSLHIASVLGIKAPCANSTPMQIVAVA